MGSGLVRSFGDDVGGFYIVDKDGNKIYIEIGVGDIGFEFQEDYKYPDACKGCPNRDNGFCHCTLGTIVVY